VQSKGASFRAGFSDAKEKDLDLPFVPITLAFQDLHYFVPNPAGSGELELLKGIYGVFRPGVLTALMGASGAGKVRWLPAHGTFQADRIVPTFLILCCPSVLTALMSAKSAGKVRSACSTVDMPECRHVTDVMQVV
jgi:hypothetical protein